MERDQHLSKAMGYNAIVLDFSTWLNFGILWEWSQSQGWWQDVYMVIALTVNSKNGYIHPDRFADQIYEYLKVRETYDGIEKGN